MLPKQPSPDVSIAWLSQAQSNASFMAASQKPSNSEHTGNASPTCGGRRAKHQRSKLWQIAKVWLSLTEILMTSLSLGSTKWDAATVIESVRLKTVLQVQLPEGPKLYPCLNTFALIQTNHVEPLRLSTYLALSLAKNRLGKIKSTNRHRTKAAVPRTQSCHGCSHINEPSNRT